jgi:hypothetical protein
MPPSFMSAMSAKRSPARPRVIAPIGRIRASPISAARRTINSVTVR